MVTLSKRSVISVEGGDVSKRHHNGGHRRDNHARGSGDRHIEYPSRTSGVEFPNGDRNRSSHDGGQSAPQIKPGPVKRKNRDRPERRAHAAPRVPHQVGYGVWDKHRRHGCGAADNQQ